MAAVNNPLIIIIITIIITIIIYYYYYYLEKGKCFLFHYIFIHIKSRCISYPKNIGSDPVTLFIKYTEQHCQLIYTVTQQLLRGWCLGIESSQCLSLLQSAMHMENKVSPFGLYIC